MSTLHSTGRDASGEGRTAFGWRSAVPAVVAVFVTIAVAGGVAGVVVTLYDPAPSSLPPGSADDGGAVETVPDDAGVTGSGSAEARGDPTNGEHREPSAQWLDRVADDTGIPRRALRGYAAAQLRVADEQPDCLLSWPTLAAIGEVESDHGRLTGGQVEPDGRTSVDVIGVALDGGGDTAAVSDTDGGELDGDPQWDRAVGPMQFLPSTWQRWGVSAGEEEPDPHHIDDAALSAGRYLCSGDRDMTVADHWWSAVLEYNESENYANDVLDVANTYVSDTG